MNTYDTAAKQAIKQNVSLPVFRRLLPVLLLIISLVLPVSMLVVNSGEDKLEQKKLEAQEFYPWDKESQSGYVYVDTIGVSDWVYSVNDGETIYYTLLDKDWYPCAVKMDLATFMSMREYNDWFNEDEHQIYTESDAKEFFPADSKLEGECVWVNAVGVSDWVYKNNNQTYYLLVDEEGYAFMAVMYTSDFEALSAQHNWFTTDDAPAVPVKLIGVSTYADEDVLAAFAEVFEFEDADDAFGSLGCYYMDMTAVYGYSDPPNPKRLYGVAKKMPNDVIDAFAEVWGYADRQEASEYFGYYYLDMDGTPYGSVNLLSLVASLFIFLAAIYLLSENGKHNANMKRSLNSLEKSGKLQAAAADLADYQNQLSIGGEIRLAPNFLFCSSTGAVAAYEDIVWSYLKHNTQGELIVNTVYDRGILLVKANRKNGGYEMLSYMMDELKRRNPDMLIGYNGDNAAAYHDIVTNRQPYV